MQRQGKTVFVLLMAAGVLFLVLAVRHGLFGKARTQGSCLPEEDAALRYPYQQLSGKEQQLYTALYDAMGISLNALRKKVAEDDKVLVTVVTDGYENASKEYSGKAIKALVDELKAKGWVFAYIGANQDVEAVAATISITNVMNFETTSAGTHMMTDRVNRSRERLYCCMAKPDFSAAEANENFFDEDDK